LARTVAASSGLTLEDLKGATRRRDVSRLRLLSAYLGRERLGIPIAELARLFLRDDSGLAHGVRSLKERIAREPELKQQIERIANNAKLPA
jgi:chromosomal replication initiation ATPase DnaA